MIDRLITKIFGTKLQRGEDEISVGEIVSYDVSLIIASMNRWCFVIDKLIDEAKYLENDHYYTLVAMRGFTYKEYRDLFNPHIEVEEFPLYPVFQALEIETRSQLHDFTHGKEYSHESYVEVLKEGGYEILVESFYKRLSKGLSLSDLMHSYILAKTRSGKTEFLKVLIYRIYQKLGGRASFAIIDPHGDLAKELSMLEVFQDDLVYIDLRVDPAYRIGINPMVLPEGVEVEVLVGQLMGVIEELIGETRSLSGNMKVILRPMLTLVVQSKNPSLEFLLDLLRDHDYLMKYAKGRLSDFDYKTLVHEFNTGGGRKSVDAVRNRIIEVVGDKWCYSFLCGETTLNLRNLLDSGKVVIFNLSFTKIGEMASVAIGKFILAQIKSIGYMRGEMEVDKRPLTFVMVDECQNFITPSIQHILSQSGKFGLRLLLSHQYTKQLNMELVDAILSNTDVKGMGRNDPDTMAKIYKQMGLKSPEPLNETKKYHFWIKSGDKEPMYIKCSDKLLYKKGSPLYVPFNKQKQLKYYKRIDEVQEPTAEPSPVAEEKSEFWEKDGVQYFNQAPISVTNRYVS